jgi:4-hydroxybenzoate polyprenyltransferase
LVLALYLVLTTAYSFYLKRRLLLDAVTLAALYTIRVFAGAVAVNVALSEWLLAFSMFLFFSLALIKRHSELALRFDAGMPEPSNRGYRIADLPIVAMLGAASGFSAVIVFSFYLASDAVRALYRQPSLLWLACPLLLYWIARMIMLSNRRALHDDPVIFAMRDPVSIIVMILIFLIGFAAA